VYRLVAGEAPRRTAPRLDPTQQAVVDHEAGPLLVLAGPGTGKTTTIVEAVAARIDAGVDPEQILVLTFSRKAAAELRTRITGRVARTIREPLARTFHSYAYGVLRRAALLRGDVPPRLHTSAEQDAVMAELLRGDAEEEGDATWPRIPGRRDAAPNPRGDEIPQPEHAGRRRDAVTVWHSNHSRSWSDSSHSLIQE
jgi:superfamily I DNA/RNA helicase